HMYSMLIPMWEILLPLLLLFIIGIANKIPKIGGNIKVALLVASLSSIIIYGLGPKEIILAFVDGIDRLSWVILLSIFGAIYAESQVKLGAIDTTLNSQIGRASCREGVQISAHGICAGDRRVRHLS